MIHIFQKKKKLTVFLALTTAILMLCTGCVRSGVGVVIEPDGSGTVEVSIGINEEYIDMLREYTGDEDPFAGKDTSTLTDGDDNYICIVENKPFHNLDELKSILLELDYNFEALDGDISITDGTVPDDSFESDLETEDDPDEENYRIFKEADVFHESGFFSDSYRLSVTTMPHEMEDGDLSMIGMSADHMYKLVVSVTLPGNLTAEGAEINDKTATFTVTDLDEEHDLTAESAQANVSGMISVGVAVIVLIVVLIYVLGRKKAEQNQMFE